MPPHLLSLDNESTLDDLGSPNPLYVPSLDKLPLTLPAYELSHLSVASSLPVLPRAYRRTSTKGPPKIRYPSPSSASSSSSSVLSPLPRQTRKPLDSAPFSRSLLLHSHLSRHTNLIRDVINNHPDVLPASIDQLSSEHEGQLIELFMLRERLSVMVASKPDENTSTIDWELGPERW